MAWIATAVIAVGEAVGVAATVAAVATVVSEVGIALQVVGAVTGNKDMQKLGGTMSMVGGIGGLAAGAIGAADGVLSSSVGEGIADGTGATLSGVDAAAGDATTGLSAAGDNAISNYANMDPGAEGSATTIASDNLVSGSSAAIANGAAPVSTTSTTTAAPLDTTAVQSRDWSIQGGPNGPAFTSTPVDSQLSAGANAPASPGYNFSTPDLFANVAKTPATTDGFFQSFSDFANKNQNLFNMGEKLYNGAMNRANQVSINNTNAALKQQEINQKSYGSAVGSMGNGVPQLNTGNFSGARK